jgi:flavin reductase (DIM6/NTAB) family NADH-FMN oxidoreductase RutF
MISFKPNDLPRPKLHQHILGGVAPRPIAFASTIDKEGNPNLSPYSFFNAFGINPTTLIFSPSRRGRDNTTKHTYENLKEVPEVVINAVTWEIVQQTSLASTEYDRGVNEFIKAGLTMQPSEMMIFSTRDFWNSIRPLSLVPGVFRARPPLSAALPAGNGSGT